MSENKYLKFNNYILDFNNIDKNININALSEENVRKILTVFDKDNNNTIQSNNSAGENEINSLWECLKKAAATDDNKEELTFEELKTFLTKDLKVDDKDIKKISDLLVMSFGFKESAFFDKRREERLDNYTIEELEKLPQKNQEQAKKLIYLENRPQVT